MATPNDTTKTCTKCGETLPATTEYFYVDKRHGLIAQCKHCRRKTVATYRKDYPDKVKASQKRSVEKNKDHYQNYYRIWRENNRELLAEYCRLWRKRNPEKAYVNARKWRQTHKETKRAEYHRRRARKLASNGNYTKVDVLDQIEAQNHRCWWCDDTVDDDYHIDHRIPLSRGGSNNPENICIACPSCNLSKNDKMPWEWSGRLL